MKRIVMILLVLTCMLGLVGCDPAWDEIDGDELLEHTVKIELYDYENTKPKLLKRNRRKKPVFDFDKATFIAELEESRFEDLIMDMDGYECIMSWNALNEPIGKTLVLYQDNGNMFVLFSCVYKKEHKATKYYGECIIFDENGVFIEHIGSIGSDYVDTLEALYFEDNT